ncbi:MAG: hypothetical protein N2439_07280 [Anaerolineae bacterium]|nr:hypothetical protein [Anaerolineae bacterium]
MRERMIRLLMRAAILLVLAGCTASPAPVTVAPSAGATPPTVSSPAAPPATPKPTLTATVAITTDLVTVRQVASNPQAFNNRRVRIQGHGVIAATLPLCAGYVGLDRRANFVDAEQERIVAEVKWKPPEGGRMYDPDRLRVFEGYIRIFSGEIGCPGATKVETFPYFEIIGAE